MSIASCVAAQHARRYAFLGNWLCCTTPGAGARLLLMVFNDDEDGADDVGDGDGYEVCAPAKIKRGPGVGQM